MTHCRYFLREKAEELKDWAESEKSQLVAAAQAGVAKQLTVAGEDEKKSERVRESGAIAVVKAQDEGDKLLAWAKGMGKILRSPPIINSVVTLARSNAELVGTVD